MRNLVWSEREREIQPAILAAALQAAHSPPGKGRRSTGTTRMPGCWRTSLFGFVEFNLARRERKRKIQSSSQLIDTFKFQQLCEQQNRLNVCRSRRQRGLRRFLMMKINCLRQQCAKIVPTLRIGSDTGPTRYQGKKTKARKEYRKSATAQRERALLTVI